MDTTPAIQDYAAQFGDASFTACIEQRLKQKWKPEKIRMGIRGTLSEFPDGFREQLQNYLDAYVQRWFDPSMPRHDMRIVFIATIEDLRENAPRSKDGEWSDAQLIAMFNVMTMNVTIMAHMEKSLRKAWGIKKPWF